MKMSMKRVESALHSALEVLEIVDYSEQSFHKTFHQSSSSLMTNGRTLKIVRTQITREVDQVNGVE